MKDRASRRSWSRAEKRRIVEEAFWPGASVADVARRHGLNANQLFNWRKTVLARAPSLSVAPSADLASAGFMPLGVVVADNPAGPTSAAASVAERAISPGMVAPRRAAGVRTGMIEIELANGMRLRVDAFVNERAPQRVLSVLQQCPSTKNRRVTPCS